MPASWPVIRFANHPAACPRLDLHAVYLGTPGPNPICPADLVGKTEAVMVSWPRDDHPRASTGTPARRGTAVQAASRIAMSSRNSAITRTITDTVGRTGVQVAISYGTNRPLALVIQSSVRPAGPGRIISRQPAPTAGTELTELTARTELLEHTEFAHSPTAPAPATPAQTQTRAPAQTRNQTPARTQTQGVFIGNGFDACATPSASAMTKWLSSPFRAVGVYIGGANRACAQVNLTPSWLTGIAAQGWHYFALYPGLQSSCVQAPGDATITTSQASAEGKSAADDAVTQATSLGIPPGAPLIYDMEAYGPSCDSQVTTFLSAWDSELQARGYTSGVYESFTNIGALIAAAGSMTEPQVIYYADWDGVATTTSSYMPSAMWTSHQRLHQFQGGHLATYGGVTIDIDNDRLDVNLGAAPTPAPPSPANPAAYRISVGMNANGTAEWFARSAGQTLTHSWQQPVGSLTWSAMHQVGRSAGNVTSNPTVAPQADGALTIFARASSGRIVHAWQQAGFPNDWEWGKPLPARGNQARAGTDPASLLLPTGLVGVFETTSGGSVTTTSQLQPNDNAQWATWHNIGGHCASSPVPIVSAGHNVDVFCVTTSGSISIISWNGMSWGQWGTLGKSPAHLTGVPALVLNGAGQIELFATTKTGGLDDAWQSGAGGGQPDGTWTWGTPLTGQSAGTLVAGSPAAATWPVGQVIVYARLGNGQPEYIRQQGISGSAAWNSWSAIGGVPGGKMMGSPAGWLNSVGAASIAVIDRNLKLAVSSNTGGGWSAWSEVGSGF